MTLPKKSGSLLGTAGGTQAIEEGLWPMESPRTPCPERRSEAFQTL